MWRALELAFEDEGSRRPRWIREREEQFDSLDDKDFANLCPAPARYRSVPAAQPGGGKQMICYSEKVAPPLYQPAPGSPSRARGAPEGAPATAQTATSPVAPPPNPVYYAMNV
ncbi:unnamed protein product [Plutella xylostella]|uniref:(diamondback moth) hypothetical protein n=1 Tax=Plutella xylostella TaxID=51655 RepID=A0A8S4G7N2_PLUXY|nr:unnamed protein product [Plutella xylostella]